MRSSVGVDDQQGPNEHLRRVEVVARGVFEKSKFSSMPPRAKTKIFQPVPFQGRWELSTFSMDGLDSFARWNVLDSNSSRATVGRSELTCSSIEEIGLSVDPNWEPERHVNVVGWPDAEDARLSLAQALRDKQEFILREAI